MTLTKEYDRLRDAVVEAVLMQVENLRNDGYGRLSKAAEALRNYRAKAPTPTCNDSLQVADAEPAPVIELKTWPTEFEAIHRGGKRFEYRKFDRPFCIGSLLRLREWNPDTKEYSGREITATVSYMLSGCYGIPYGYAVLSIDISPCIPDTRIPPSDEAQIKHMVDRFLAWRLPENFNPDAGISFKADFNEHTAYPMKSKPTGTNLFDATQAEAMVRHLVEGMPGAAAPARVEPTDIGRPLKDAIGLSHPISREQAFEIWCSLPDTDTDYRAWAFAQYIIRHFSPTQAAPVQQTEGFMMQMDELHDDGLHTGKPFLYKPNDGAEVAAHSGGGQEITDEEIMAGLLGAIQVNNRKPASQYPAAAMWQMTEACFKGAVRTILAKRSSAIPDALLLQFRDIALTRDGPDLYLTDAKMRLAGKSK